MAIIILLIIFIGLCYMYGKEAEKERDIKVHKYMNNYDKLFQRCKDLEFKLTKTKDSKMTVNKFNQLVAKKEGGKKEINIAQIGEIVRIVKDLLKTKSGVDIYDVIHKM